MLHWPTSCWWAAGRARTSRTGSQSSAPPPGWDTCRWGNRGGAGVRAGVVDVGRWDRWEHFEGGRAGYKPGLHAGWHGRGGIRWEVAGDRKPASWFACACFCASYVDSPLFYHAIRSVQRLFIVVTALRRRNRRRPRRLRTRPRTRRAGPRRAGTDLWAAPGGPPSATRRASARRRRSRCAPWGLNTARLLVLGCSRAGHGGGATRRPVERTHAFTMRSVRCARSCPQALVLDVNGPGPTLVPRHHHLPRPTLRPCFQFCQSTIPPGPGAVLTGPRSYLTTAISTTVLSNAQCPSTIPPGAGAGP